jgi:hypothetical protein
MRIDDSGQYSPAPSIDNCYILRNLEVSRPPNGSDAIPLHSNKTINDGISPCAVNYGPIGYD